jgi:hypothetical protein
MWNENLFSIANAMKFEELKKLRKIIKIFIPEMTAWASVPGGWEE